MNAQFPIALHILGFLASRRGESLTSEVLAQAYGTNPVVLRRVLAKLQRAGLVATQRGARGGSVLARDPADITLREAFEAVTGDAPLLQRFPNGCSGVVAPAVADFAHALFGDVEAQLLARLERVTVAQMDRDVRTRIRQARVARPRRIAAPSDSSHSTTRRR